MWWQLFLQEASLKIGPNLSLKCVMFQYLRWRKSERCVSWNVTHHCENPIDQHGYSASSVLPGLAPFIFGNLSLHWRDGDVGTLAQFKNSLLFYVVQTVEKMLDIFVRDRVLKECPLCRSQYGC